MCRCDGTHDYSDWTEDNREKEQSNETVNQTQPSKHRLRRIPRATVLIAPTLLIDSSLNCV